MRRIGMLTPSSNTALEPITQAALAPLAGEVTVHFSRFRVTQITLGSDALGQFDLSPMLDAARLLADAPLDAIIWNGTSGAWLGVDADRRLCEAITRETGVPADTAVLAQLDAMRAFGVRKYALCTPYLPAVNEAIARTFDALGFTCVRDVSMGISVNKEFNEVPLDRIRAHIRDAAHADADAICILCTNFPAAYVVEEMEQLLGKPILDSTLIAAWAGLRRVGIDPAVPGWGRMMRGAYQG